MKANKVYYLIRNQSSVVLNISYTSFIVLRVLTKTVAADERFAVDLLLGLGLGFVNRYLIPPV